MLTDPFFGLASVVCFSLPVITLLSFRLFRHISLLALLVYYALAILRCAGNASDQPAPFFKNNWEVLYSYFEIPLLLSTLLFFCPPGRRQQKFQLLLVGFLVYELAVALLYGISPKAGFYVMLPGLLLVVVSAIALLARQLRFFLTHGKNAGRVLMLAALVLSYCFYLFLFVTYFLVELENSSGLYALFFLSSGIAAVMMSAGLFLMRHRLKELQEIKVTRRELQIVFGT